MAASMLDKLQERSACVLDLRARQASSKLDVQGAGEAFDASAHEHLLIALWKVAFPAEPYQRKGDAWLRLGFQTLDPAPDLRGVGVFGLMQILRFCKSAQREANALQHVCQGTSSFPLATISLN